MTAFAAGVLLQSLTLTIPRWRMWVADAVFTGDFGVTGQITVEISDLKMLGTVVRVGDFVGETRARIVGGYGGWGKEPEPLGDRLASGLKLAPILADAARECGETMGSIPDVAVGTHYGRLAGPATNVFSLSPAWWIDDAGVTQVSERASGTIVAAHELLEYDAAMSRAAISTEFPSKFRPGLSIELGEIDCVTWRSDADSVKGELWLRS